MMPRSREQLELQGVVVDDLTDSCLKLATIPEESDRMYERLESFFRDSRHRLNQLKIALYLARRARDLPPETIWDDLERSYGSLEQLIDRLQLVCRPLRLIPIASDLDALLGERRKAWGDWLSASKATIEWLAPTERATGWFDPGQIFQGLDALVAWRGTQIAPGSIARLTWWADDLLLHVNWQETAASVPSPLEGSEGDDVTLALPVLARVVSAHDGQIRVSDKGGLSVEIEWPVEPLDSLVARSPCSSSRVIRTDSRKRRPLTPPPLIP